ncbi:MAG TPA: XdhC/CoxI family protein [Pyrinomonadaceae bacterium]|jgi:xanthine/CO dehydrogenase XdhC/CoxF family maturation factor
MKELQEILKKISALTPGEKAVLATVVDVKGSSYRRAGARMLIGAGGETIGTVSGGCLESDVLERAKKVLRTGEPEVFIYDTTEAEDSVFSLNMGCRGVIRILLELFENENILARALRFASRHRQRQFIATMISSSRALAGGRIFYSNPEQFDFENLPADIENFEELKKDCLEFFVQNKSSEARAYRIGEDDFELFFENINPPLNLLLFGAGYDAIPLAGFAGDLGWRVTLIDHRAAWASAERFPSADEIIVSRAENLDENLFKDEASVGVLMTHNYEADREILYRLLNSSCRYIGALGPKKRTENLIAELRRAGKTFDESKLNRLYAPIGLDIGAESPEEIALAIIAEIRSVLSNREAGFLRRRDGGIH